MEYVAYLYAPQKIEILGPPATNSQNSMFSLFGESWCTFSNYLKTLQLKKEKGQNIIHIGAHI